MKEMNTPEETPEDRILALLELIAITQLRQLDLLMSIAAANATESGSEDQYNKFLEIIKAHEAGKIIGDVPYMSQ